MSDEEADLSPEDPSEAAVMALAISQADELMCSRLNECGADPDMAFTFKWLSENSEVLWLHHRLDVDFAVHMDKMFRPVTVILTLVIDPDCVIEWQMKNAQHWIWADNQYLGHQALLLGQVCNRSKIEPPGEPEMVFSCTMVWVSHDQATITVPQALEHLSTIMPQEEENLTLCKIPTNSPFWPSLPLKDKSYLVMLLGDSAENLFGRLPQSFQIYRGITYHWDSSFQTFMALNKVVNGKADIQFDEATFYYIKPWEVLWINDLYSTEGDNDQSVLAVNPLYLVGPNSILLNPVLEFKPTIAVVVTAAFAEEPTAEAKAFKVAEYIVMVGKKQFDMMMCGDQTSDSASSLTIAITHVKLEPCDESAIPEDVNDSLLLEDTEEIANVVVLECNTAADEAETVPAIKNAPASVPLTMTESNAQPLCPRPLRWWLIPIT